jgi:hypothetical protein
MPIPALAVNEDRAAEIIALMNMPEAEFKNLERLIGKDSKVSSEFSRKLEDPAVRSLISLRRFSDRRNADPADVVEALEEGLRKFGWDEGKLDQFKKRKGAIASILKLDALHTAQRVLSAYHDVHFHLHNIAISTELKPIVNAERATIEDFILYNILKIIYSDGYENEHEVNVTLELEELQELKTECELAQKRTSAIESQLKEKMNAATITFSENPFGDRRF